MMPIQDVFDDIRHEWFKVTGKRPDIQLLEQEESKAPDSSSMSAHVSLPPSSSRTSAIVGKGKHNDDCEPDHDASTNATGHQELSLIHI